MNPKYFEAINKCKTHIKGEFGLPSNYPCPPDDDNLLFYIQRNHNFNTVVYEVNLNSDGLINMNYPINVFWIRYSENAEIKELNYIQNKLAYGYESKQINQTTFEFELVSYREMKFYVSRQDCGRYAAFTKINDEMSQISNIYVYVEDFGLFPDVQYIEVFGHKLEDQSFNYEKIMI